MTKEEAKKYLDNYRKMYADLAPERFLEALDIMLNEPVLPSNLDEAAEEFTRSEYSSPCAFGGENIEEWVSRIFKAGAKWMAGQGETKRGVATQDHFIQFADGTYIDLDPTMKLIPAFKLKDAEEIFVQIRKKQ